MYHGLLHLCGSLRLVEVESVFEFDAVAAFARTEIRRKVPDTRIPLGLARGYLGNVFWTAEVAGSRFCWAPEHLTHAHLDKENVRFSFTFKTPSHFLRLFHPQVIMNISRW